MNRVRIYNARILTMLTNEIEYGEVWIKDSEIEYIGPNRLSEGTFNQEIDAKQNLLMPGFKNAHAHSAMTFARSLADGMPLFDWLNQMIFPMEAKLTPEHIYYFSKLAYMEYLTSGITAAFDMYYEPEAIIRASEESGFRTVLCGAINDFKETPEILESYYQTHNQGSDLISYILGFHAEYTTSLNLMKKVSKLAEKYQAPVFVHNSETKREVEECIGRYGKTPTGIFDDIGIYQYGGGGFHCIYLNEEDVEIFKKRELYIVINPASNLKIASGIAPAFHYLQRNLKLAIGTDGASSNNALDMFREMYLTSALQKIVTEDPALGEPYEVLRMATVNGALAMGLKQSNVLAVGKKADMIMLDLERPNMQPINNIINNIVYSGSKDIVKMTIINGKILYENGDFLTIDKEEVYSNVNRLLNSIR